MSWGVSRRCWNYFLLLCFLLPRIVLHWNTNRTIRDNFEATRCREKLQGDVNYFVSLPFFSPDSHEPDDCVKIYPLAGHKRKESSASFSFMQIRTRCSKTLLFPACRGFPAFREFSCKFVFASLRSAFYKLTPLVPSPLLLSPLVNEPRNSAIFVSLGCVPFKTRSSVSATRNWYQPLQ